MKKVMVIILVIGCLLLGVAAYLFVTKLSFLNQAEQAIAKVVEFDVSTSKNSDGKTNTYYYPILTFTDKAGQTITFTSSVGTGSQHYQIGEQVDILYNSDKPSDAEINSFWSIWLGVVLVAFLGFIDFIIAALYFMFKSRKNKVKRDMLNNGRCIEATITSVELNTFYKVNGRSPYLIYCQWSDKLDPNSVYSFKSENIWFDPKPYINKETIAVYLDQNNSKRYYVDISFLPKLK